MTRLFVIPGHGAGDSGACGHGYSEAERVRALAAKIKELGGDAVELADFDRNYYEDGGINRLQLDDDQCIVELHMDSGPSGAMGGHVIVAPGQAEDVDYTLSEMIAGMFPGRANILVERDDLANPARAAARGFSYRLVENGFISNWDDLYAFNENIEELARIYLRAFGIEEEDKMAMAVVSVPMPGTPVFRLYNEGTGEHMFTANEGEAGALVAAGWKDEGTAWANPDPGEAVYRMYNRHTDDHMFTANFGEALGLQSAGWTYEGVFFFGARDGKPVYRLYDGECGRHMFTADVAERNSLVSFGWRDEGVAWRV